MGLQSFLMNRLIENSAIGKKIQSGSDVSKKGQFALDATEKNPNIEDSMAEKIANLENETKKIDNSVKKIISLPNGASTGDAQIEEAKVGIEGETYDTLGDAIREQVKTYRDVDVSNNKPTGKARVWVNTASNDTESQDILLPQVDDNNVSDENTWSSKKINEIKEDVDWALMSKNLVNKYNIYKLFRIGGDSINNAVFKKDVDSYWCCLIPIGDEKSFTISHTDTGAEENGYRYFKAIAVDIDVSTILAFEDNHGISTDHIQWLFAETGDYVQTKQVTVSDNMKTLVVEFSKTALPSYIEVLAGLYDSQQYESYRESIIPLGNVYDKTESDLRYVKMKQICSIINNRLIVNMGKSVYWIERRTDKTINLDTWLIQRIYVNGEVIMAGTDIEGPIKAVGANDFIGGIHGDELMESIKILIDGVPIDITTELQETMFSSVDVFVTSTLFYCDTQDVAFERNKHLSFKDGNLTITNSLKNISKLDYPVYRWPANGIFSVYKDLMNGYSTNVNCEYITNTGVASNNRLDDVTFYGTDYNIEVHSLSEKYDSYSGFVNDFANEARPRFKVYFDTLNGETEDVKIKSGDTVNAAYEIIIR